MNLYASPASSSLPTRKSWKGSVGNGPFLRRSRFCNLASWSVLPEYRFHSVRLLKALLAQHGYHFTDLAPSEKVESVNARFKFRYLDACSLIARISRGWIVT